MVELKGTHRFNDCNNMKMIMPNMQNGVLSTEEQNTLNSNVMNEKEVKKQKLLETKYVTFYSAKDRISTQLSFEIIGRHTIM
jgi:hypothetical protein